MSTPAKDLNMSNCLFYNFHKIWEVMAGYDSPYNEFLDTSIPSIQLQYTWYIVQYSPKNIELLYWALLKFKVQVIGTRM